MPNSNPSELPAASSPGKETWEQMLARWERREEEARDRASQELAQVLESVRQGAPHWNYLVAGYSGSGDEGCLEYVGFVETEDDAEDAHPWNPPERLDTGLPEDIDQSRLGELLSHFIPGGYENNEGGQGVVRIDLETGEIEVAHEYNVTEVVSEPCSFQLTVRRGGLEATTAAAAIEQDSGES